ncbi:MAG: cell division protein SepF [Syntrophomonadaceae bacterium]|jgi:cell division inhibitor SepF
MSIIDKVWTWFGVQTEEEREEVVQLPQPGPNESERKGITNLVSIHTNKSIKVVVCEPHSFDEAQVLADHLKSRKQIILNFENTAPEVSQKIIDFISGTTYALEGNSQQLGNNIFLFAPSNVEIAKDHRYIMRKANFPRAVKTVGGE